MKIIILTVIISTLLTACASSGVGRLPNGNYQLSGYDGAGNQRGNMINIDVPFSDQTFAIGLICSDAQTTTVVVEQMGNVVTKLNCSH